ncbi:MAG: hypothetical protein R2798_02515 [Chitinophagales bacterium]|nr:hypothetical protein [Bacteroidota bacterium]MCB9042201.1 hypothetical protein [Chitinophagales bacterium]
MFFACLFALRGDKENTLHYLAHSLAQKEITPDFVKKDEDWKNYRNDEDFINLLKKYTP